MKKYVVTIETDKNTTEYPDVMAYGTTVSGRWVFLRFVDNSLKQIQAAIIREIDVAVQR